MSLAAKDTTATRAVELQRVPVEQDVEEEDALYDTEVEVNLDELTNASDPRQIVNH